MKKQIIILLILLSVSNSCQVIKYAKYVQEDAMKKFISKKIFFRELGFVGLIDDKMVAKESSVAPYRLIIIIESVDGNLNMSNDQNPPYYYFDYSTPRKLELSVTKEIYDEANQGDKVVKIVKSDSIQINLISFEFLKSSNSVWY